MMCCRRSAVLVFFVCLGFLNEVLRRGLKLFHNRLECYQMGFHVEKFSSNIVLFSMAFTNLFFFIIASSQKDSFLENMG